MAPVGDPSVAGTAPLGVAEVAGRAARGAVALGVRQVAITAITLLGSVVLARLLSPAEFGVYAVAAFLVAALRVFGDAGLGMSLVRQLEEPSPQELRAVFAVQQVVVVASVAIGAAVAPLLLGAMSLGEHVVLVWLFLGATVVTSFQTVPSIRLERALAFGRIGSVNVVETVTFTGVAIALAAAGAGVVSFGIAAIVQALVGTILLCALSPWSIGWTWRPALVRARLRFGIPYQGISLVSFVKDSITPVLIGLVLGAAEVGFVKWSQALAAQLLLALMALDRVYFPAFARLQDRPVELRRFVEAVVRVTNTLAAPIAVLLVVYAVPVADLVYGEKWRPALPVFYWLCAANLIVPTASPLFSLLNARGESGTAFRFALLWMGSTWALGVPLVLAFGMVGFGVANCFVQLTNGFLIRRANRGVDADLLAAAAKPWLLASITGACALGLRLAAPPQLLIELGLHLAGGLALYATLVSRLDRATLRQARTLLVGGGR